VIIAASNSRALIVHPTANRPVTAHRRTSSSSRIPRVESVSIARASVTLMQLPRPLLPQPMRIRYLSARACNRYAEVEQSDRIERRDRLSRIA